MSSTKQFALLVFCLCCAVAVTTSAVRAVTLVVTNNNDSGEGSLREALESAADGDTIVATNISGTITLTTGELLVTNIVTITGPGPSNLSVNGGGTNRVFDINAGTVTISGLAITNGATADNGGGIHNNQSTLIVSNCLVSGNSAHFGGGIYNNGASGIGTLKLLDSTVRGNVAADGGGIFNESVDAGSTGRVTILNSTLSDNSAMVGGGIYHSSVRGSAILSITNSTFSGNTCSNFGGGILNNSLLAGGVTVTIDSCTFSGNSSDGIFIEGVATLEIGNTILNAGASSGTITNDVSGTIASVGYNLSSDSAGGFLTNLTDLTNTDPVLGPLADNGGPTFTHALLCGSPAIDAVATNANCLATDQRGVTRPQGPRCDIGAFELETNNPPVAVCTDATIFTGPDCTATASGDDVDSGSTGDCLTLSLSPPGPYALGETNVTLIVVDVHGTTNTCMASIMVVDTTAPSITCPGDITTNTVPGVCNSTNVSFSVMVSDNCAVQTNFCLPASGSKFDAGDNTVTCTAVDTSGNTNTCSFTVTVVDHQAPTITCPANISTNTAAGACNSTNITYSPTASDNCAVQTNFCLPSSGSTFDVGTNSVTCTAVDTSGNTNTCSFSVTVVDHQAPTITCPANIVTNVPFGETNAVVVFDNPTINDNCEGATFQYAPPSGSTFGVGDTTITSSATDAAGNTNSCTFTVTVGVLPDVECSLSPATAINVVQTIHTVTVTVLSNDVPAAGVDVTFDIVAGPNAETNDTLVTDEHGHASFSYTGLDDPGLDIITATGLVSGVSFSCDAEKVWVTNSAPIAVCQDVTVSAGTNCTATASIDNGSSDIDSNEITLVQSPAGPYELGTNVVVLTVTDSHGASSSCTGSVIVVDTTRPVISCPENVTAPASSSNGAVVTYTAPTATDNCSVSVTVTSSPPSGVLFAIGDTEVTATATDESGNATNCTFIVHVEGPSELVSGISDSIAGLDVSAKLKKPLTRRIDNIGKKIADGKTTNACKQLASFIIKVTKLIAKGKLSQDAETLIDEAVNARAVLGCQ